MIHVIATITVHPGQRDALLAEFRQLMPAVHAEQGCIEYGPAIDADSDLAIQQKLGSEKIVVIEKWESVDALKAHGAASHMLDYRARVKHLVAGTDILVLQPAG